jgi:hypothetical protein
MFHYEQPLKTNCRDRRSHTAVFGPSSALTVHWTVIHYRLARFATPTVRQVRCYLMGRRRHRRLQNAKRTHRRERPMCRSVYPFK